MVSLSNHRRRKMAEPMDKPVPPAQEGCNYRLAINPDTGEHGYEIGYWPPGATTGADYVILGRCYDQQEAARMANQFNAQGLKPTPTEDTDETTSETTDEDEDEPPHRRGGRRK
jgi:hypothetical protein